MIELRAMSDLDRHSDLSPRIGLLVSPAELLNSFVCFELPMDGLKPGEAETGLLVPEKTLRTNLH